MKRDINDELLVSALSQAKDDEHRRLVTLVVEEFVGSFMTAIDTLIVSGTRNDD